MGETLDKKHFAGCFTLGRRASRLMSHQVPFGVLSRAPIRGASMVISCPARYPVGWSRPAAWAPKSEIASTP